MSKPGVVITVYNEGRSGWRRRERDKDGNPCGPYSYEDELSERYEGNELLATLDSVRAGAGAVQVVVVDDGSDDGCCERAGEFGADVFRHDKRYGIGYSRTDGVDRLPADCDTVMFLDAHQRITPGCVDHCAELALRHDAIILPDVRGLRDRPRYANPRRGQKQETATQHGCRPRTAPRKGEVLPLFRNYLIYDKPPDDLSRTHALNSPGYCMPRSVWDRIPIGRLVRGFGANEPMLWVKAFFLDIPMLHTCGAMVRHLFRQHDSHYTATAGEVHGNMAILARTCFSADTWERFWWPKVFKGNVSEATERVLDSYQLSEQHLLFQAQKKRSDAEFWLGLCREPVPFEVAA